MRKKQIIIFITLLVTVITSIFLYNRHVTYWKNVEYNEKYGEIDKLLDRVDKRVDKLSDLSFNEKEDVMEEFKVKFIRHLYPNYELIETDRDSICDHIQKPNVVCVARWAGINKNTSVIVTFKRVDTPDKIESLKFYILKGYDFDLEKKYNYNICYSSSIKDVRVENTDSPFYFGVSTTDAKPGFVNDEINRYYLSGCSSDKLREQLAKMNYKNFSSLEKQRIEEFIYGDKAYQKKLKIISGE